MVLTWKRMAEVVVATLSSEERLTSIVYLDEQLLPSGSTIQIDGKDVNVPWLAAVAFVDLQPGVNWGHRCRYLVINAETGAVQSYDGQFPPFLVAISPQLRTVWKGKDVPVWAVVRPEEENSNEHF